MRVFLLITGISGSGKSEYCRHLQTNHGFFYIDTDTQPPIMEPNRPDFVVFYHQKHDLVAMEWGFIPNLYLKTVLGLKNQGAKLFWFTCPANAALFNYSARRGQDPSTLQAWHTQYNAIQQAHLPTSEFKIVETMREGKFRQYEELDKEVLTP